MIDDKPEESIVEECRSEVGPEVDKEAVLSKRVQKSMNQKQRKQLDNNLFPKLGHEILFKENDSDIWKEFQA